MNRSPAITHCSWGRLEVDDGAQRFKDAKLYPGGARAWDWGATGTSHVPGIQIADVEELLAQGSETVILSQGVHERLQVQEETLAYLKAHGIETHVLQTEEAVRRYHQLRQEQHVGGLFHSTC